MNGFKKDETDLDEALQKYERGMGSFKSAKKD